ncbi:universal stress protein [Parasphingorhabdus pacifica]
MVSKQPVLVGVDGSSHSLRAVQWAAAAAERHRTRLHLLLVNDDPARTAYNERAIADLTARCRASDPDLNMAGDVVSGHPVEELVRRSATAQLVVVGSRGHGGFVNALIGSVGEGVAMHAICPVVVVRGESRTTGPIVVGVDADARGQPPGGESALQFAFETADRWGTDLLAVQALPDAHFVPDPFPRADRKEIQQQADLNLAECLAGWSERYPDVPVRRTATNEHPVDALHAAAGEAQLLVVGHRGRGGFAGLLLGSVARGILHHSTCPVAVVRTGTPSSHGFREGLGQAPT